MDTIFEDLLEKYEANHYFFYNGMQGGKSALSLEIAKRWEKANPDGKVVWCGIDNIKSAPTWNERLATLGKIYGNELRG